MTAPAISVLDALADPELFAPAFQGGSWGAWRAFLAALSGLPMDSDALAVYAACTGRAEAPTAPFTEAALIVGRRGGKSRVLGLVAVFLATFRDYEPFLAPGEVATIAVIAANRSQARTIFRYVSGLLKSVPVLAPLIADETADTITLSNRVVIEISTASFRTTRGYSFAAVLCDEIAFWRQDENSANPDIEILRALRPGMASIPGSILLIASSPYAKRGELYNAYRRHFDHADARVLVWKADTATMNPRISPEIIAEAYSSDPEAARAEYGAEFRDDLADFVTREIVDAVTCWGRSELPPESGVQYSAFCDPSGGAADAMTLAIGHLSADAVAIVDAIREARPPFDPEAVVVEFAALLLRYGVSHVQGDHYGGEWPRQRFREHGIAYEPSARPKSDLYRDLLPLLNAQRVELLDHPRLSAQLVGLERRTARSGRDSIDHSPGGHDDTANAVAGLLVGLDLDRRPALIRSADLLVAGGAAAVPHVCDLVFAVIAVGDDGTAAAVFVAYSRHFGVPLVLLDFAVSPLVGSIWAATGLRLRELTEVSRPRGGACLYLPAALAVQAVGRAGIAVEIIPSGFAHAEDLGLAAAGYIAAGEVKMSAQCRERAATAPFHRALDFSAGDAAADPLRIAALQAILLALDETDMARAA